MNKYEQAKLDMNKYRQLLTDGRYEQYYKDMIKLLLFHVNDFENKLEKIDKLCNQKKDTYIKELQKDISTEKKEEIIKHLGNMGELSELLDEIIEENSKIQVFFEKANLHFELFSNSLGDSLKEHKIDKEFEEPPKYTLHEAMIKILKENGNHMKVSALTEELNRTKLYQKADGTKISYHQIFARARRYDKNFDLDKGEISIKDSM